MIRILFFVAVILALGLGFAWMADRPGEVILEWQDQRLETSLLVGIAGLVTLLAATIAVLWLLKTLISSPGSMQRFMRNRKRDRGYEALSRGLIAAGAGDAALARRMTRKTRAALSPKDEPLIHVLEAQTYMIEGRHDDARAKFEAMAEMPETRALGLRGLYLEARRLGATEAAQHYAEKAVEKVPHLPWAGQAALEYRSRDGDWDKAIRLLEKQRAARIVDKGEADRKRAVLLTARAMEHVESDPKSASSDAQEAFRLAPGLVPAAVTAAKALFRLNDLRRGSKILEKSWKANPHPEIADTYVRARSGDSVQDRLKRARKLEALKPNHVESLRIVAQSALDAHEHDFARQRCEASLRQQPREGLYLLMADIEEADTGDQGRVRHWMNQALRAPRDPAWTADGYVAEEWAALSPVTGEIDAFVWKTPVEQLNGQAIDASSNGNDGEKAIQSLPPVESTRNGDAEPAAETVADLSQPAPPKPEAPQEKSAEKIAPQPPLATGDQSKDGEKSPVESVAEPRKPADSQPASASASNGDDVGTPKAEKEAASPSFESSRGRRGWGGKRIEQTPASATINAPKASDKTEPSKAGADSVDADKPQSSATVISLQPPAREAQAEPTGSTDQSNRDASAPSDVGAEDSEKERQFLNQRIDDPGVKQPAGEKTTAGTRFRLF